MAEGAGAGGRTAEARAATEPLTQCKDLWPILGYGDGVLKVGRKTPICSHHTPIVLQYLRTRPSGIHHGLDCEDHSWLHGRTRAAWPEVRHLGLLVHRGPYRVAYVLAHNREPCGFGDPLDRPSNLVEMIPGCHLLDSRPEAPLRDVDQALSLLGDLPDWHRERSVSVVALDDGPTVDREDVPLLQYVL